MREFRFSVWLVVFVFVVVFKTFSEVRGRSCSSGGINVFSIFMEFGK